MLNALTGSVSTVEEPTPSVQDKGKAVEPVVSSQATMSGVWEGSLDEELARVCRERDEAKQELQELRS